MTNPPDVLSHQGVGPQWIDPTTDQAPQKLLGLSNRFWVLDIVCHSIAQFTSGFRGQRVASFVLPAAADLRKGDEWRYMARKLLIYDGDNLIDTIELVAKKQPYSLLITRLYNCRYGLELCEKTRYMAPMLHKIVAYMENPDYATSLKNAGFQILQAVFENCGVYLRFDFGIPSSSVRL